MTVAPRTAMSWAIRRPSPDDAPVTTATEPGKLNVVPIGLSSLPVVVS